MFTRKTVSKEFAHVKPGDYIRAVFDKPDKVDPTIVEMRVGSVFGNELHSKKGLMRIWASGWEVEVLRREPN